MPFCARCRFEYTSNVATCPDCGGELVESLPEARKAVESDFAEVALCVVRGEIHAKLLQNVLIGEGIPSRLTASWPFEHASTLQPPWPIGGGYDTPIRIMVKTSDLPKAKLIYDDFEHDAGSGEDASLPEH